MNDIVKAAGRGVSADMLAKLQGGIAKSRQETILPGGKPFLRLITDGTWVYGQEDTDVQEGSYWVVNPMSILHGWSCWTNYPKGRKNELLGEVMGPVYDDRPHRPEDKGEWPFKEQKGFDLRCLTGDDEGTEVVYKTSSVGGMRAVDGVLSDIQRQIAENPAFLCPIYELQVDSYKHTNYGKTYIPIFTLIGWCDMEGNRAPAEGEAKTAIAAPAAEPEKPARKRRAAAPAPTPEPTRAAQQAAPEPDEDDEGDDAPEAAVGSVAEAPPARTGMPRRRPGVAR